MILEYKIDELSVRSAWLKTLYDLIEELNCKCQTFFEESYNTTRKCFGSVRIIKISGHGAILNWLKLRMQRYDRFISENSYLSYFDDESSF